MRTNAAKKMDDFQDAAVSAPAENSHLRLLSIVQEVSEAHNMSGNAESADFEEFLKRYRITAVFA